MGGKPRASSRPKRGDRIRVVTINFWGIEAPLERRLELAIAELDSLDVDVVCIQEVRPLDGRSGRTTADVIAEGLGMSAHYRQSLRWNDDDFFAGHAGGQEGLAILSRHPVLDVRHHELPDRRATEGRIVLSARIAHQVAPLWVHTTHHHYRLDDGAARERQVLAVDKLIGSLGENPQLVAGDFNAPPDADEMRFLRGLTSLDGRRTQYQDAWRAAGDSTPGITWSARNHHAQKLSWLELDRRIDYIYVTPQRRDGRGRVLECRLVLEQPTSSGIFASDHFGVLADVVVAPATR